MGATLLQELDKFRSAISAHVKYTADLEAALKFYADGANYGPFTIIKAPIPSDRGAKARRALRGE